MANFGSVGAVTIVDEAAAVGPLKVSRVTFPGDGAYVAGGSLGLADKLSAAAGEKRTILGVQPAGPNGDTHLEYTPKGAQKQAKVVVATDVFSLVDGSAHGYVAGDPVRFTADDLGNGNLADPALPAGVAAGTTYYVIAAGLTATAFKVSATAGGATIDVTSVGGSFQAQKQDLLLVRVMSTGVESAVADQSATTYGALVTSY